MNVRVRFAPSPTGYLHIGAARTALYNWLFARKHGGKFLLRIEDTDLQRSTEESTRSIFEGLAWLGLDYDEEVVFQSANAEKHRAAARRLLEEGKAYRDFTPREERSDANIKQEIAERARRAAAGAESKINPYRDLPREESDRRAAAGEPFAIRLKVPREGRSEFYDIVYGKQEREYAEIEDLVLVRSDGHPLYNLSVVCDDIEMGITHVIRGQDHLTNTHKQILIYRALGAPVPQFAHLPLILAPNKAKLSKRKHGEVVSLTTYRDRGFVPAAFRNFLALLGWSPADGKEIMTLEEMIERFSLEGIHRSNAIFNFNEHDPRQWTDPKALWMNAEYIHHMPLAELLPLVRAELEEAGLWRAEYEGERRAWFERTVDLIRQRFHTLKDFSGQGRAYFSDEFAFDEAAVEKNLRREPRLKELLPELARRLETVEPFTAETVERALRAFAEEAGVKAGLLINAARTALTGQAVGPSMFEIFETLGRERSIQRLRAAVDLI
ncbi:glutamate--tRNA ligase [Pyrinomonas methylaliphatogenes]|jgi:glutamyl-tRNA synthetase|uniref:Glutamate--tRNA ligase n=1 Tax=Pyrinomonas methylaliphatogenes TaxID=454194 RepID=A0A0B6X2I3_9BACT|nr:glutamate--tRNA ligase [Pyrinomonas methylaliphatogenes]MBX5479740.1 glutamate--tRNA ligase [Pyrinomonas methylaliphatogenes]CDM66769.1 glutamyl-tRNA synthetase [Pyrinomonas methylaliphatogenes]